MYRSFFSFSLPLLLCVAIPELRAHDCGPTTITVSVGQSIQWQITADEGGAIYNVKTFGDTSIVGISPTVSFRPPPPAHGVWTFTGRKPGTTTFVLHWLLPPSVEGDCQVTVTVKAAQQPDIDVKPTSLSFSPPPIRIGDRKILSFQVFNTGGSALNVSDISSDNGNFFASPKSFSVAAGDSQLVDVVFEPGTVGFKSGTLTIVSDDPDESEVLVSVSGEGGEPDIDVGPLPLPAPPAVTVGDSSKSNFRVTNEGNLNLILTDIASSNPAFSVNFQGPLGKTFPYTIPPGTPPPDNFQDFDIFFKPTKVGPDSTMITITSDDPDESELVFTLKSAGLAPAPDIHADSSTSFLLPVAVGGSSIESFKIANLGTADLIIQNISTDNAAFTVNPTSLTIAKADSKFVIITFAPTKVGLDSTLMTIVSNDPDEGEFLVKVFGRGGVPDIDADTSLVFQDTLAIGQTDTLKLRVFNKGNVTLEFDDVISSNPEFFVTNSFPTEIRVDGTEDDFLDLDVVFKPSGSGLRTGTLILLSNDPDEPAFTVAVSGVRAAPNTSREQVAVVFTDWLTNTFPASDYPDATAFLGAQPLAGGTRVQSFDPGELDITVPNQTWFGWALPGGDDMRFGQPGFYLFYDDLTGQVDVRPADWWPVISGENYLNSIADREQTTDRFFGASQNDVTVEDFDFISESATPAIGDSVCALLVSGDGSDEVEQEAFNFDVKTMQNELTEEMRGPRLSISNTRRTLRAMTFSPCSIR